MKQQLKSRETLRLNKLKKKAKTDYEIKMEVLARSKKAEEDEEQTNLNNIGGYKNGNMR